MALPVPPVPPRSGPAPTDDPLSPTTLILNYLRAHNVQPTAANVREAVLANAREGNQLGADPIAGLRSDRPATEAEDQAAMRAVGKGGGGGGGGGSSQPTDPSLPKPGTPTNERPESGVPSSSAPPSSGNQASSAQPTGGSSDASGLLNPATMALLGIPVAGAAVYGLDRLSRSRGGAPTEVSPVPVPEVAPAPSPAEVPGTPELPSREILPDPMKVALDRAASNPDPMGPTRPPFTVAPESVQPAPGDAPRPPFVVSADPAAPANAASRPPFQVQSKPIPLPQRAIPRIPTGPLPNNLGRLIIR